MPTKKLSTSVVNADHRKGRQATDLFRAAYNKVALDENRAQALNENAGFPVALRRIIEGYSMPVSAPTGGRLHIVRRVPVNPARDWQEAINVLPNTGKDWDIRKDGELYPPQDGPVEEHEVILVNFGKTIPNGQYAIDRAKPLGLKPADPRKVFAICEHKPTLHRALGVSVMAVVSLITCSFGGSRRVPNAWWSDDERFASLLWFDSPWDGRYWFAFVRK